MAEALSAKLWDTPDTDLVALVDDRRNACLDVYRRDPSRVREDARKERATTEGGYGRKQILELVQNAADAMLDDPGRIEVRLTSDHLYVANQGSAFTEDGVVALLYSHLSAKTDEEIGRFGLGFKSVAAISDKPQVFSRTVSFEFDGERAADEIAGVVPGVEEVPSLRLAWPLSTIDARGADRILAEQMAWATTIIKIPVGPHRNLVAQDMKEFPGWFVLFARHVQKIELIDTETKSHRTVAIGSQGASGYTLQDSDTNEVMGWKVFDQFHRPSEAALENAGLAARREKIKVSWAVPTTGRVGLGQLSAFFPINESTSLSGMINAPWKLSDDRSSLIEGEFNREILEDVLPDIVASALPHLFDHDNPGRLLDMLPARGREIRGWADQVLNQPVMTRLSASESLPDLNGVLRRPKTMRVEPEKIESKWVSRWASAVAKPERWVDSNSVSGAERRAKALRLLAEANGTVATAKEWLMATMDEVTASRSATAIFFADQLRNAHLVSDREIKTYRIVLLEDGDTEVMQAGRVYLRSYDGEHGPSFVHSDVVSNEIALDILKREGVSTFDRGGELHQLLLGMRQTGVYEWEKLWFAMRSLPVERALEILEDNFGDRPSRRVNVRSGEGNWVLPHRLLIPGSAIPGVKSEDRPAVVDMTFHRPDADMLGRLGISKNLRTRTDAPSEAWVATYSRRIAEAYINSQKQSKPSPEKLVLTDRPVLGPLEMMPQLSEAARVNLTKAVLTLADRTPWQVKHSSNASYGTKSYSPPEMMRLREYGLVQTLYGPLSFKKCLSPFAENSDTYRSFVPVAPDDLVTANDVDLLGLKKSINDFSVVEWAQMVTYLAQRNDVEAVTNLYSSTVDLQEPPENLQVMTKAGWSLNPAGEVAVAEDQGTFELLFEMEIPVLLIPSLDARTALIEVWGLFNGHDSLRTDVAYDASGESAVLVDEYPPLRNYLWDFGHELQKCKEIVETVYIQGRGARERRLTQHRVSNVVLVTASDDVGVLLQVAAALELTELTREAVRDLLTQMDDERLDERRAAIRYAADDRQRLLLTAGEAGLRAIVRTQALDEIESNIGRKLGPDELVGLCTDLFGYGALRKALKANGVDELSPPTTWGGRLTARRWVTDLGFGVEWAGEQSTARREAMIRIDGPVEPDPLHTYQRHIADALKRMIGGEGPGRGLVSLPTGAGKTRVAVQAVIEAVAEKRLKDGPVVWLAESDELCEQAVDTWTYLWRAMGASDRSLAISRFWGGNTLAEEPGSFQVVVTARQKLINVVNKVDYAWLTEASLVIVDEAHGSVSTSYTTILEWLGRGRSRKERRLLVGLTATPFRNSNDAETDRLAARYDRNRLDRDAFGEGVDPYKYLQDMEVLARVSQRELEGAELTLSTAEAEKLESLTFFPSWAEQRVGDDKDRNDRIVESIKSLPDDFPVLLFAVSVENAEVLAALLSFEGISAAAISASTPDDERASIIQRFKDKELRVITNYNVLAQGFDAPAVRAVYITRPTYSQVLYQQMIGRGLRGPKNNGSHEVLIVNVLDNIAQYGESLAFYDFEPLWATSE